VHFAFWREVNSNFLNACVLEWCKLFADEKGKFYWKKIATNPQDFESSLFLELGISSGEFQENITKMLDLRDKHIAHSDLVRGGFVPQLDFAKRAIWFYYRYVVNREAESRDLAQLPLDIERGYQDCEVEAKAVYDNALLGEENRA
jgi:hypothetical protein